MTETAKPEKKKPYKIVRGKRRDEEIVPVKGALRRHVRDKLDAIVAWKGYEHRREALEAMILYRYKVEKKAQERRAAAAAAAAGAVVEKKP